MLTKLKAFWTWLKSLITTIEKDIKMATDALAAQVDSTVAVEAALVAKFQSVVNELTTLRAQVPALTTQVGTLAAQLTQTQTDKDAADKAAADAQALVDALTTKLKASADALTAAIGQV